MSEPKKPRKPRKTLGQYKRNLTLDAPAWTDKEADTRAVAKATRIIVLYELYRQGRLNDVADNKEELAKLLGVTRWTLDRSLAALHDAIAQAAELLKDSKI